MCLVNVPAATVVGAQIHALVLDRVADYKGKRTYEDIVKFVASGGVNEEEDATASENKGRPKKTKRARASTLSRLQSFAFSLLTEHDPLQAGLVMLGIAVACGGCMMLALCAVSRPSAHR